MLKSTMDRKSKLTNTSSSFLLFRFTPVLIFLMPALSSLGQYAGWPPLKPSRFGAINFVFPLLIILLVKTNKPPRENELKKSPVLWLILTYVILSGVINFFYRGYLLPDVKDWLVIVLGFASVIVLPAATFVKTKYLKYLVLGHLFALWLQFLIIIIEKVFGFRLDTSGNGYLEWRLYSDSGNSFSFLVGSLGNPNNLAMYLVFTLPVALFALRFQRFKSPYIATVLLGIICIFSTESRSGVTCLIFELIIYATIGIHSYIKISKFSLSLILMTTFFSLLVILNGIFSNTSSFNSFAKVFENFKFIDSDYARLNWTILAFQKVTFESPFFGFGTGSTARWLIGSGLARAQVHNGIVQIGFEYGLVPMFLFLLILILLLFQSSYRFLFLPNQSSQLLMAAVICSVFNVIYWMLFTSQAVRDIPFWWGLATTIALATSAKNEAFQQPKTTKFENKVLEKTN